MHPSALSEEFFQICTQTFKADPTRLQQSSGLIEEYARAHAVLKIELGAGMNPPSFVLANKKVNLEALECVLRKRYPQLRIKFLLCGYLLESRSEFLPLFLNHSRSKTEALWQLCMAVLGFIKKLAHGLYLRFKYDL